ncbi:MAG: hypothetical protein WD066_04675 [Planctomycetaceae bacterium]
MNERILIGALTAILCAWGLWSDRWFLEETRKGRALARRVGPDVAVWILRALFFCGILFGLLLATGIIRPVRW